MAKKKVIWLVCNNVQPPEIDTHLRHQKFAKYLKEDGYEVYIIGASYLHYAKRQLIYGDEKYIVKSYQDLNYIFIKVASYADNVGVKRFFSNFEFAWHLFKLRKVLPRPDLIVHNTRIPCDLPILWTAKRLKAIYITETWDLWPYSFVSARLFKENSLIMKLLYRIEKYVYSKAERNIFTCEGCRQYIIDHKWDKNSGGPIDINNVHYINNGVDIDEFDYNKTKYFIDSKELTDKRTVKIVYLGSISAVNDVNEIIETAKLFDKSQPYLFLIFGDGMERDNLEKKVNDEHIDNVHFMNKWVEIKYVPYILSCADINLLNYDRREVMKYGGSQGKLFQYLAAGKPIVSNSIRGYDIVNKYGAGISENIASPQHYKDILCSLMNDKKTYDQMCENAKLAAKDFDFKYLYGKFKGIIDEIM